MKTLIDAILNNKNPKERIHFIRGAEEEFALTYETLKQRALGLCAFFRTHGIVGRDEIILLSQRNEAFIEGFWAAILGGNPAVPLSFGISDEHKWKLFRVWKQLRSPWLLLDMHQKERLEKFAALNGLDAMWKTIQEKVIIVEQIPALVSSEDFAVTGEDDTAIIQFSSGTTSEPKGIVLSHGNVMSNIRGIIKGMAMTNDDSTFSWMPLTHDMGLIGFHLTPFVQGVGQYLMPTDLFIRRPSLWFQKINSVKASVTCSPNFGYQHYLNALDRNQQNENIKLDHIRLIFNGAEPISVSLTKSFLEKMAVFGLKESTMFTVYGLAEASLAVAFPEPGKAFRYVTLRREDLQVGMQVTYSAQGIPFVIEGTAIDGCEIRIVGLDQSRLPSNHIGKVEIKGNNVTKGYLGQDTLNSEIIREGWLDTGDLGFLTSEGELVITGRWKDILFVNGQNYYPHDVEQILENQGIAESGKVAVTGVSNQDTGQDKVLVFLLYKGKLASFASQVSAAKELINEQLGIAVQEVVPVNQLPKTTSGKIQRYQLSRRYEEGDFDAVIAALRQLDKRHENDLQGFNVIERTLKEICDKLIVEKPIAVNENIFEIGTSSLVLAQIHQHIEEVYPGKVEVTDFFDYPTIRELAGYIAGKND